MLERLLAESGTPAYVYSRARLLENFHRFDDAFKAMSHQVLFAVKANTSGAILSLLGKAGAGADIVSVGELFRARRAGIPADRIVFSEERFTLCCCLVNFSDQSIERREIDCLCSWTVRSPLNFAYEHLESSDIRCGRGAQRDD